MAQEYLQTKELAALRAEHEADVARLAVLQGKLSAKPAEGADIAGAADWSRGPACKRLRLRSAAERERDVREAWCASGVSDSACELLGHGDARGLRASSSVNPAASRAPQSAAHPADEALRSSLLHITGGVASASALAEALAEVAPKRLGLPLERQHDRCTAPPHSHNGGVPSSVFGTKGGAP